MKKSKRKQISPQYDYLRIKNSVIKRVNHVKYLGLFLDEHLSWEIHITQLCNSLARYFSIFYNIRNMVPINIRNMVAVKLKKNSYTIHLYILELHME